MKSSGRPSYPVASELKAMTKPLGTPESDVGMPNRVTTTKMRPITAHFARIHAYPNVRRLDLPQMFNISIRVRSEVKLVLLQHAHRAGSRCRQQL